jgi:RNA-directed DNA polymerase
VIEDLRPYIIGWRGYFRFCQTPIVLTTLEAWIPPDGYACNLWRQLAKTAKTRFKELRRRGDVEGPTQRFAAGSPTGFLAHVRTPRRSNRLCATNISIRLGLPPTPCARP